MEKQPFRTKCTIDAYNKNAEKYQEKFGNYQIYRNKIREFQQEFVGDGADILDLGCGPGNNIETILENRPSCQFTGIDLSEAFIARARSKFPQFTFIHRDIRGLRLKKRFDVILASFCIVHLSDRETETLLGDISHLLKETGALYLSYMNGDKSGFETTSFSDEKIFFNYYQDENLLEVLIRNGFDVVRISKEKYLEADGTTTLDAFIFARKRAQIEGRGTEST